MQLGVYNSGNAATTNNPSFVAAQDYEDALLERLANVEDEIPRACAFINTTQKECRQSLSCRWIHTHLRVPVS